MTVVRVKTRRKMTPGRVRKAAKKANLTSLRHAAAVLRLDARRSIRKRSKRGKPAAPGKPPKTKRGQLRRSILFDADADSAIVGPSAKFVGESGSAHEHGGRYRDQMYPERPFMRPALEKLRPRLSRFWSDSLR